MYSFYLGSSVAPLLVRVFLRAGFLFSDMAVAPKQKKMSAKAAASGANAMIQSFVHARSECVEDAIIELNTKFRQNHSLCLVLTRMLKKKENEALLDGSLGSSIDVGETAVAVVPVEKIIKLKPFQKRWRNLEGKEHENFVFAVLKQIRPLIFGNIDDWSDVQKEEFIQVLMCLVNVERDMLLPNMLFPHCSKLKEFSGACVIRAGDVGRLVLLDKCRPGNLMPLALHTVKRGDGNQNVIMSFFAKEGDEGHKIDFADYVEVTNPYHMNPVVKIVVKDITSEMKDLKNRFLKQGANYGAEPTDDWQLTPNFVKIEPPVIEQSPTKKRKRGTHVSPSKPVESVSASLRDRLLAERAAYLTSLGGSTSASSGPSGSPSTPCTTTASSPQTPVINESATTKKEEKKK